MVNALGIPALPATDHGRTSRVSLSEQAQHGDPRAGQGRKEQTVPGSLAGLQFNGRKHCPEQEIAQR